MEQQRIEESNENKMEESQVVPKKLHTLLPPPPGIKTTKLLSPGSLSPQQSAHNPLHFWWLDPEVWLDSESGVTSDCPSCRKLYQKLKNCDVNDVCNNACTTSNHAEDCQVGAETGSKEGEAVKANVIKNVQICPFPTAAQLNPYSAAVKKSTKLAAQNYYRKTILQNGGFVPLELEELFPPGLDCTVERKAVSDLLQASFQDDEANYIDTTEEFNLDSKFHSKMSLSLLLGEKRKQNFAKWQLKIQEGITGILNQKKNLMEQEGDSMKRYESRRKKSSNDCDDTEAFEFAEIDSSLVLEEKLMPLHCDT